MRRVSAVGSTLGALLIASACATATGTGSSSRYSATPTPTPQPSQARGFALLDSVRAQSIADREGPGASIHTEYETVSGSRRARAVFHLDDDAYVMIGHIDPDGVVRIVFPSDPSDDGFVKGDHTYRTAEFFAGFNDQFRYRALQAGVSHVTSTDSYDGGIGYVFMIAAWRPMRFDSFKDGAGWSSYELASVDYMRDPRPAIQELASLLVGDARESYTLKFARYFDSQPLYAGLNSEYSTLGFDYCAGSRPFGFASPIFNAGLGGYGPFGSMYQYGYDFTRRGTTYSYDAAGDCYRTGSPYSYGYYSGYQIAQTPNLPPITSRPRKFDLEHRNPAEPRVVVGHKMPPVDGATPTTPATTGQPRHFSPEYRQRGLITNDDPSGGPVRRQPRIEPATPTTGRVRPTLEEMTNRHAETPHEGSIGARVRAPVGGDDRPQQGAGAETPVNRGRMQGNPSGTGGNPGGEQRTYQRPEVRENPRGEQPARSEPSPRMQAPERSSPPPAPRVEAPPVRSAPPPSAPPPSAPHPQSQPAQSSGSPVTPVKPPTT